ncbi:hypothetical protein BJY00DRAFT_230159 [Aspergillus carlsbadensis]|nr:hypothetical protein BJY00DRAFT_230159 [Aspergillus carlsbadensis]
MAQWRLRSVIFRGTADHKRSYSTLTLPSLLVSTFITFCDPFSTLYLLPFCRRPLRSRLRSRQKSGTVRCYGFYTPYSRLFMSLW